MRDGERQREGEQANEGLAVPHMPAYSVPTAGFMQGKIGQCWRRQLPGPCFARRFPVAACSVHSAGALPTSEVITDTLTVSLQLCLGLTHSLSAFLSWSVFSLLLLFLLYLHSLMRSFLFIALSLSLPLSCPLPSVSISSHCPKRSII